MWNKLFEGLRRRMTCISAAIYGVLILLIVFAAYSFIWWNIKTNNKFWYDTIYLFSYT